MFKRRKTQSEENTLRDEILEHEFLGKLEENYPTATVTQGTANRWSEEVTEIKLKTTLDLKKVVKMEDLKFICLQNFGIFGNMEVNITFYEDGKVYFSIKFSNGLEWNYFKNKKYLFLFCELVDIYCYKFIDIEKERTRGSKKLIEQEKKIKELTEEKEHWKGLFEELTKWRTLFETLFDKLSD